MNRWDKYSKTEIEMATEKILNVGIGVEYGKIDVPVRSVQTWSEEFWKSNGS